MSTGDLPRLVGCPFCLAAAGQPCLATTAPGTRPLAFLHLERERAYDQVVAR